MGLKTLMAVRAGLAAVLMGAMATVAAAQNFTIESIVVDGNRRIETSTIANFTGITPGTTLDAAALNTAIQNVRASGLFETVVPDVRGGVLFITVEEFPTVNVVDFEGNNRLSDDILKTLVRAAPRRVFSADQVEADATRIAEAYANQGRIAATVTPRIIERSDNRVDVVFEIVEGAVIEIERISFVGNRSFSDRRLRRVLESKQAGIFRLFVTRDVFIEDRLDFDRQVLADFYASRGFIDFQILSVNAELNQTRDAFFITFQVREGQQFAFGDVSIISDVPDVTTDDFNRALTTQAGDTYSPVAIDNTIERMERQALDLELNFIRIEPKIERDETTQTVNLTYVIARGERRFIERIDISGNTTTRDNVIRRQFRIVEGDPFNPREIRRTARRIRALGFFGSADVQAREGSRDGQVVLDVDVTEQPTGTFNFGLNYNSTDGAGLLLAFKERNFLGRGQAFALNVVTGSNSNTFSLDFTEPALFDRNLAFGVNLRYRRTDNNNARYDTQTVRIAPSLAFPISETGRLSTRIFYEEEDLFDANTPSGIITAEAEEGLEASAGLGYTVSFDNRRTGLNPRAGVFSRIGQDFHLTGAQKYVATNLSFGAQTTVLREDVTLSAEMDVSGLSFNSGNSRVTDRFFASANKIRGFRYGGIGPREINGNSDDALGGNYLAATRFEARFPIGLPDEYGITGGAFVDFGSVWGLEPATLDTAKGTVLYEDFTLRSTRGLSLFWNTPIGPLRFNFSRVLKKEDRDRENNFDLTIATRF